MKTFSSLFTLAALVCGLALTQCATTAPAFASGDNVVQNNHGVFVKSAASGIYTPVIVGYSTDGQGGFIPAGKVPGGYGIAPVRLNTASTSIVPQSYAQLEAASPAFSSWINVYNGTTSEIILATGSSGAPVQVMDIAPSVTQSESLYIPAGTRLSVIAATTTASSGVVILNFLQ